MMTADSPLEGLLPEISEIIPKTIKNTTKTLVP